MVNRLRALNLVDFTGGLNLRPEVFQLLENEVPDLLNMEPDQRGGLATRYGWQRWHETPIAAPVWNPRNAFLHIQSDDDRIILLANGNAALTGGEVWARVNAGAWTNLTTLIAPASPHLADFASWDDKVWCVRGNEATFTWDGTGAAMALLASGPTWQNDYANPGATDYAPKANLIAQHSGYMFVAGTVEDSIAYPNRIRWSHPNNPARWAADDYIDVSEGGGRITALISFSDRLLVFKQDSVWALFGYNAETWEVANISRSIGCVHQQAVCRNESTCWFLSWPQGVFAYTDRGVAEVSSAIRRVFARPSTQAVINNTWLGWVGRRLWVSTPWDEVESPTDATSAFVFDPEVGAGAWMEFRGADGTAPGAYIEGAQGDLDAPLLAFSRSEPYAIQLDALPDASDDITGTPAGFSTRLRTRWLDAGAPTHNKSWRRPDFLMRNVREETVVNIQVYHDFDFNNPERRFDLVYSPTDGTTGTWGEFDWGDGTLYGAARTSAVERGSTMGRAGAVQLIAIGTPSKPWGFNGIIFKYIPRRFR